MRKIHDIVFCVSLLGGIVMTDSKNPSAVRSKTLICDALLRLMEQHPYEEITVKQIALEAKLVRKTFYRNFDSKEDVLESIFDTIVNEYKTHLVMLKNTLPIDMIFEFCLQRKHLLMLFDKNNMMYRILQKLNDAIPEKHEELVAIGAFPLELFGDLDPYYLISMNTGGIWNVICRWVREGMKEDPKKIGAQLTEYIINMGAYAQKMKAAKKFI